MRKKIGIVGYVINNSFGVHSSYMNYFSRFGNVEIISHTETEVRDLDLLVIPGGPDVDTSRYLGEDDILNLNVGNTCIFRERFDKVLLPKYVESKTPIFGICRGHQSLAVFFGGKLEQDMYHETNFNSDGSSVVHNVKVSRKAVDFIHDLVAKDLFSNKHSASVSMGVNSRHHQVVSKIPTNAVVLARYEATKSSKSNDECIEALYYPGLKIASVQWHPEDVNDLLSIGLILKLLKDE